MMFLSFYHACIFILLHNVHTFSQIVTILPVPKNKRGYIVNSNNYRAIAICNISGENVRY